MSLNTLNTAQLYSTEFIYEMKSSIAQFCCKGNGFLTVTQTARVQLVALGLEKPGMEGEE